MLILLFLLTVVRARRFICGCAELLGSGGRSKELEGGTPPKKNLRRQNCEKRLPNEQYIRLCWDVYIGRLVIAFS